VGKAARIATGARSRPPRDERQLELGGGLGAAEAQRLVEELQVHQVELEVQNEELRSANQRKDEFLNILSHELRNPLAPICTSLHVAMHAPPGSDQARRALVIADRQAGQLRALVDDLLDVTRIAHGKMRLRREAVDLCDLVRRSLDDHRASYDAAGIRLESRLEQEACWVHADPGRLTQVLGNLLGNAEKFTPGGGSVSVAVRRRGERAAVLVRDTGCGIPAALLPRIFDPFAQAPQSLDRMHGGLGLGLALVKGLVELHGGHVAVASDGPGRGTELRFELPLTVAPTGTAVAAAAPCCAPHRVLIIEDCTDAADILRDALALAGHDVEVAYDGPSGLERARRFRPGVVFCDIGLPEMDGFAVARAFRADPLLCRVYLVALTGYAAPDDVGRAAAAGFDRHVTKPATLARLERVLAEAPAAP
jgi:two-component system CheB/CheR fusion protein